MIREPVWWVLFSQPVPFEPAGLYINPYSKTVLFCMEQDRFLCIYSEMENSAAAVISPPAP